MLKAGGMAGSAFLLPYPLEIIFVLFLGLVLGSFASALAYRAPRRLGWGLFSRVRSECPSCNRVLGPSELVPLCSWLVLRGKCKGCKTNIPLTYPLIEGLCLILSFGVWAVYGFTLTGFVVLMTVPFLAALLAVDLEHMILPNSLVAALLILGIFYHGVLIYLGLEPAEALAGFIFAGCLYGVLFWFLGWSAKIILKRDALGFGDVKFFGVCGFWLGLRALSPLCLFAGASGLILGLFWKFAYGRDVFPFGPALILSFYALLLLRGAGMV